MTEKTTQDLICQQGNILEALSRTLGRESHILTQTPDLLWQQLYNRLQWEGSEMEALLMKARETRKESTSSPWLWQRTPPTESGGLVRTFAGHSEAIDTCQFSSDGSQIISWDKRDLKVWNAMSGKELHSFTTGPNRIRLSFNKDHAWVIEKDYQHLKFIIIKDRLNVQELCTFSDDIRDLHEGVVSPDGSYVIFNRRNTIIRRDIPGGKEKWRITGAKFPCEISHDGTRIIANYRLDDQEFKKIRPKPGKKQKKGDLTTQQRIKIWDASTGREVCEFKSNILNTHRFQFSPDDKWILSATDRSMRIWDAKTGELLRKIEGVTRDSGYTYVIRGFDISPDGKRIVCSYDDSSLRIWDSASGEELQVFQHTGKSGPCCFSPDGTQILAASSNLIHVWDAQPKIDEPKRPRFIDDPLADALSNRAHDFNLAANGSWIMRDSDHIMIMDSEGGKMLWKGSVGSAKFPCVLSPDGSFLASRKPDYVRDKMQSPVFRGEILICKLREPAKKQALEIPGVETRNDKILFGFTPDSRNLMTQKEDIRNIYSDSAKTISIWDVASGEKIRSFGKSALGFAFIPDGVGLVERDKFCLRVWNITTGEVIQEYKTHQGIDDFAVSPDGNWIVSVGQKRVNYPGWELKIINSCTGEENKVILGHYNHCAVSPDAHYFMTSGYDRLIEIWEIETGRRLTAIALTNLATEIQFHPFHPRFLYKDVGGSWHVVDLVGLEYRPLVLTAFRQGKRLSFRCPACRNVHTVSEKQLGADINCPTPGCNLSLKLNPFVLGEQLIKKSSPSEEKPAHEPPKKIQIDQAHPKMSEVEQKEVAQVILYRKKAENGDPSAQMMLGTLFANGRGVEKDLVEAAKWYRKAAKTGHTPSQLLLATCYKYGNGIEKDLDKAAEYFRKAALAGNRMAQFSLAECYEKGTGVPRNEGQAIQWYQKAADQGLALAKNRLKRLVTNPHQALPAKPSDQPPRNFRTQQPKPEGVSSEAGKSNPEDVLGKQAALLYAGGNLNGALKVLKDQEKILREKNDLRALKINLGLQITIGKELLKNIDSQIQDKLRKKGRG